MDDIFKLCGIDDADSRDVVGKNYYVSRIPTKDARQIVKKFHYSGKVISNSHTHLGVFDKDHYLVGCLQYGPPLNGPKTFLNFSDNCNAVELNRMVMDSNQPRNAESQALSLCNKWLKKNTDYDWLLSFSDGKEGNVGYIYQANNWKYLGYMVSKSFYSLDGEVTHSVTVWNRYKQKHKLRDTHTTHEILMTEFENIYIMHSKQHIYVFPLMKKVPFLFEFKSSFPKKETEPTILKKLWVQKDGVPCNDVEILHNEKLEPII